MYKKVKQYGLSNGLTVEAKAGLVYGLVNGYFVLIQQYPGTDAKHTVYLWAKPQNLQSAPATADYLNQSRSRFQYLQSASYDGKKITAEFQGLGFQWGTKYVPCLDAFLKEMTGYCQSNGFLPCCESCGTEAGLNLYQIDGFGHMFCSSCYSNVAGQIQQNALQKKQQGSGNILGGIVGALLGALIGAAVWILIYQLGYISALGGLVMVICSMKGYELLGGRLNKAGIAITCIISVLMLLFAEYICLSIEIYQVFHEEALSFTFAEAFYSVPYFLNESEVMSAVIMDLVIGFALMAAGAFGTIKQTYKENSGVINTRMVAPVTRSIQNGMNP